MSSELVIKGALPRSHTQASLAGKVNASDLASLMPQGGGAEEGAALMPKLVEIQNKMAQLEGEGRRN